jgi:YidC/Oxa1 family membrane protein insertase
MKQEKNLVLFFVLVFLWMIGASYVSRQMGWNPPPKKPAPIAAVGEDKEAKPDRVEAHAGGAQAGSEPGAQKSRDRAQAKTAAKTEAKEEHKGDAERPEIKKVDWSELVLGSTAAKSDYHIEVQLEQKGAGVESVSSSRFDAEFKFGEKRKLPLEFIHRDPVSPPSLSLTLSSGDKAAQAAAPLGDDSNSDEEKLALAKAAVEAEDTLDSELWEVVRDQDGKGKVVRTVSRIDPVTKAEINGQSVVFRTKARSGVVVTKTYRLFPNTDGFEVELKFESPDAERSVVYNLLSPHGIPIEGLWYTSTFRDVIFMCLGGTEPKTYPAYDVASGKNNPIDNTALPLRFVGVENQYFADLIEPVPPPTSQEDRWDSRATAIAFATRRKGDDQALQHADVGVRITSKPITVSPNKPVVHRYRVYTGPKTAKALPSGAEIVASYRKPWSIPGASYIARIVITPILGFTYQVTERVAHLFGGTKGNYGIAIILLTMLVRGLMFPLGRKQALSAQKMQSLQPQIKELQEKYKDDKERLTKEQFALWKKHGVNPVSGCLPALIQLPIFVGLWQALNTSFPLRHASFLWIRDLSAPDMLFHLPFELALPNNWINLGSWFNALPFVVVGLMLIQTKLFAPPPTTPDAEMQQKTMKFMMIFMGFMFYKVPSGLGIYFITSSLWAIGERLLLPKVTHAKASEPAGGVDSEGSTARGSGGKAGSNGDVSGNGAKAKAPGWFAQFWERILEEARKDSTYRKVVDERDDKGRDKDKPRPKPRRR